MSASEIIINNNTDDVTAEQALTMADSLFVDELCEDAVEAYTVAVTVLRASTERLTQIRIYSHRSAALLHLQRYTEALQDAEQACQLVFAQNTSDCAVQGLRKGETEMCWRRKGVAHWRLQQYPPALEAFQSALQLAQLNHRTTKLYQDWIHECQSHLGLPNDGKDNETLTATTDPAEMQDSKKTPAAATSNTNSGNSTATTAIPKVPKYQYYQSDKVMTVAILEPNVQPDDLNVTMEAKRLVVTLRKGGTDFTVIAGALYDEINPQTSKVQIKDEKVLIKLRKLNAYEWHELMGKETVQAKKTKVAATTTTTATPLSPTPQPIPTSSPVAAAPSNSSTTNTKPTAIPRPYASHRDWDSLARELQQEEESEKPEGDAALNKLFQQIYANADPDTRRAMIKSYQTSGGTVLSTNWKEVAEKDYEKERTAPKGMEWKTWEGKKLEMKNDSDDD